MQPDKLPENPEYAPQYSQRMRLAVAAATILLLATVHLLIVWLRHHAAAWICLPDGPVWMIYGQAVGTPLLLSVLILAALGPSSWRAIRHRQYPPPGQKVWIGKVRYHYGRPAQWRGIYALLLAALCLMAAAGEAWHLHHLPANQIDAAAAEMRTKHCTQD
ncbi:hypothetical protein L1281_002150 [Neisseria sp. HSC-16F19]|nr:hypothetical protein [Neisseria sp. HSC-16F19]MCP2041543.1 hypothetical protein [Neisseria sp. HSC-16F19]